MLSSQEVNHSPQKKNFNHQLLLFTKVVYWQHTDHVLLQVHIEQHFLHKNSPGPTIPGAKSPLPSPTIRNFHRIYERWGYMYFHHASNGLAKHALKFIIPTCVTHLRCATPCSALTHFLKIHTGSKTSFLNTILPKFCICLLWRGWRKFGIVNLHSRSVNCVF